MRNIILTRTLCCDSSAADHCRGCEWISLDNATNVIYLINQQNIVVLETGLKIRSVFPWNNDFESEVVNASFLLASDEICIILRSGQIVTVHCESQTICSSCFLAGECGNASWSPDQAVLVAVDDERVAFYDQSFELSKFWSMSSSDAGKESLVTVGWGSADTQFKGSAGKAVREATVNVCRAIIPGDTLKSCVKWRADGLYVVVSFYERQSNERRVAVFDRDGDLVARLKNQEPIEECIAVRPSGNYIATITQHADGNRFLSFYEKNGEKRHNVQMPHGGSQRRPVKIEWNVESIYLCIHFRTDAMDELEIWTVSNYEWKRQWSATFKQKIACWEWHNEKGRQMHVLFEDGFFYEVSFASVSMIVGSEALVVATEHVRMTDFSRSVLPPPHYDCAVEGIGAVHAVSFDGSHIAVLNSTFLLQTYIRNVDTGEFSADSFIEVKHSDSVRFISFLTSCSGDLMCVCHSESNDIVRVDPQTGYMDVLFKSTSPISWMGMEKSSGSVLFATSEGIFSQLVEGGIRTRFHVAASHSYDVKFFEIQRRNVQKDQRHSAGICIAGWTWEPDCALVLTSENELYCDGKPLADTVTSYQIFGDVLVYITMNQRLHLISMTTREQLGPERVVEIGSSLVTCSNGTGVIMQMPRGNLETIHPRPLVVSAIKKQLDSENYLEALKEMKKHRVDMNLLVDYKPEAFIANLSKLIKSTKDPDLICLLIAALNTERSVYCTGANTNTDINDKSKVKLITGYVAKEILLLPYDDRIRMFTVLLSALLKSSPPEVEKALQLIKEETDKMSLEKRDFYTRKWLHHMRFFVNEVTLFNAALSTYDLKLTAQIAEVSNRDPKEYVPLLNDLRKTEPESYRKYRIDMTRSDFKSALRHLSLLDDKWDEALELIRSKNLYTFALVVYKETTKYNNLCSIYAALLESRAQWTEAALLYEQSGEHDKCLRCMELSRDVEQYVSRARMFAVPQHIVEVSLKKMAVALKSSGNWSQAAKALEIANAPSSSIAEAYATAGLWTRAMEFTSNSEDFASIQQLALNRAEAILLETASRSELFTRYSNRLEVVRGIKKDKISKIKDGVETYWEQEDAEIFSETGSMKSVASKRTGKSAVSRASTTASVRSKKQVERKKQSLKEGGEYEDAALLNALAEHCRWLNNTTGELSELLPALVRLGELSVVSSLQSAVDSFLAEVDSGRSRIWPHKIHPWNLLGPLHALYSVDCVSTTSSASGMPDVITIEPEMIVPVLDTARKWKLQLL